MEDLHVSYLKLLREVGTSLDRLSALAQEKTRVVRQNDLLGLDEVLKQEQAMTLNLRGLELRRQKLVPQLGLEGTSLSALPDKFPENLEHLARQTAENLRQSYEAYRGYASMARNTLELNLHEIEKIIASSGADPKLAAAGYESPGTEPPKNMKTDFRA